MSQTGGKRPAARYDVRKGAAAYAPIIGAFGALAVPAIIVLFTTRPVTDPQKPFIALCGGLLVVAMIASLTGAIALAAIGAELQETANLPAAVMFAAVPVVVSLVDLLAAFETLSALYLPSAKGLFALITGFGGAVGVFFSALEVGDSWFPGPADRKAREQWLGHQWIKKRRHARKYSPRVIVVASLPVVAGLCLRITGVHVPTSQTATNWVVGSGLLLAVLGTFASAWRTVHAPGKAYDEGLRSVEAYGTTIALALYTLLLMIFMP